MKCKDCKNWKRRGDYSNKGGCKALPTKNDQFSIYPTKGTDDNRHVIVETTGDFGCVLFEES